MTESSLDDLRDPIRSWLTEHRDDAERLLLSLVEVSCVTSNEGAVQDVVERAMHDRGWAVDRWEATREETQPYLIHVGEQAVYDGRPNLVASAPGTGTGRSLMLQGHVDTVEVGDPTLWQRNPAGEIVGDRLYGRGACDMKGGIVSMMLARQALAEIGICIHGNVLLATSVGEEDGGLGALSTILRGHRADGVIISEPSRRSLVIAQGGSLVFRISVPGKAAHGAARWEGESAIEHFIPIFNDLLEWERERNRDLSHPLYDHLPNKFPISVGTVQAGNWASTVPDSLVAEGRLGFLPGETIEEMQFATAERIDRVAQADPWLLEHPPTLEWSGGQFASAEVSPDHPLAMTVAGAHQASTGEAASVQGVTYGADMRLFLQIGDMPTVIYGGGDVRLAHVADEYIEMSDVLLAAETMALAIASWCGYDYPATNPDT